MSNVRLMRDYAGFVASVIPDIMRSVAGIGPMQFLTMGVEVEGVAEDAETCCAVAVPTDMFEPITGSPLGVDNVPELSRTLFELVFQPVTRLPGCYRQFQSGLDFAMAEVGRRLGPKRRWRLSSSPRTMPEYLSWNFSGELPPLITPGNRRYYGLTCEPWVFDPTIRTTRHVPGISLRPHDMARYVGIHVNQGTSPSQYGPRERAAICVQAVVMAMSEGTYLFNDQATIPGFRNFSFPGCVFGFDDRGLARHVQAYAGGHPEDGLAGIEATLRAMITSERPLFTVPPDDADPMTVFKLIDKLTYDYGRLRVNPLRQEIRSPEGATRLDITAVMAFTATAPDAFIHLYGDGRALPYETCMANIRAVHQNGIDAVISWPTKSGIVRRPVAEVALELVEASAELHCTWDFAADEIQLTHEPMRARAAKRQTLAKVQAAWWDRCPEGDDRIIRVARALRTWGAGDTPVADWPIKWAEAE